MSTSTPQVTDFRALFREHAPFVWRVLRRRGVAESDVPDLCQEVFVVVHRKLPEFEGRAQLRTWLYGITVRVASGHKRLARVQRERPTEDLPSVVDVRTPESALGATRALDVLEAALAHVSEGRREAFVLFELEEMSVTEVAAALGCPPATAFSRIKTARAAIEAHLKRMSARAAPARAFVSSTSGGAR